jgi:hypothetical protein
MNIDNGNTLGKLHDMVDHKLSEVLRDLEDAGWSASDIAEAIMETVRNRWLSQQDALQRARDTVSHGFVSDGNEG